MANVNKPGPGETTRTLQIIVGAMAAGSTAFLIVALFVELEGASTEPLLTYIAAGFGAVMILLSSVVPRKMARSAIGRIAGGKPLAFESSKQITPKNEEGQLCGVLATSIIVSAAMLQGAALFAILAYVMETKLLALLTAIVLIAIIVTRIPTKRGIDQWIEEESRLLAANRPKQASDG